MNNPTNQDNWENEFKKEWAGLFFSPDDRIKYPFQFYKTKAFIHSLLSDLVSKLEGEKTVYDSDVNNITFVNGFNSGIDTAISLIKDKIEK